MPKISVYLPDELYRQAQEHELPLSALTQKAIEDALRCRHNRAWIASVRAREPRTTARVDSAALLDAVRDEFGA